ncbi:MAG: aldehyde dehydrogenase family protein [Ilumatobacteraceae bacterium]
MIEPLRTLTAGQPIVFGGDRVALVPADLAAAFAPGDLLVVVDDSGALLHIPADEHRRAAAAVDAALAAFEGLAACSDEQITQFFEMFAARLAADGTYGRIAAANRADVERAASGGRSTTRLELSPSMRAGMVAGLRTWRDLAGSRDRVIETRSHAGWTLDSRRAPLGVVAFVFEGRPNVFADAAGAVRTGNTVVFRIGSDALGTARAIVEHALDPALADAGLPAGTIALVDSAERSAGWALFGDRRLALAVARGSGAAVAQLGAVARQAGVAVSLHGTGGAWLVAGASADTDRLHHTLVSSLDRKVCNTVNVCCIPRARAAELVPVVIAGLTEAAACRDAGGRLHVEASSVVYVDSEQFERLVTVERADGAHREPFASTVELDELATEWDWERSPEITLVVVDDVDAAVRLCNRYSPRFIASLVSDDADEHDRFYASVDAPFVGDGFTRWVDGQYALDTPELGLSNWQHGRLLARGGILSGDSVHTVRYRASFTDPTIHR